MIRWLLLGLLAAVVGAGLILLISADSGYVIISIGSHTLEMSFWFAIVLLVAIFFLWKYFTRLFAWLRDLLAGSVSWISESRAKRIEKRTGKGLIYFVEGNWRAAKKELLAAARLEKKPLLQYLAAANSAFELGDDEETRFLLDQAEKIASSHERSILLTRARLAMRSKQYEETLAILKRADDLYPNDAVILKYLKISYLQVQAWSSLLELLPKLKASKSVDAAELKFLEIEAWKGQIDVAFDKAVEMNAQPLASLENIWKGVPADVKHDASVVALYVGKLIKAGFQNEALYVLVSSLKRSWDHELLGLYGELTPSDKKQHLLQAEAWLREHPGDANLLFVLGKLAMANELWGKAREYFEKSLSIQASPQSYAELAELLAQLGEHKQSVECYRKGLRLPSA